jgi:uncharacterized repeat protein (TIGR03803 family)
MRRRFAQTFARQRMTLFLVVFAAALTPLGSAQAWTLKTLYDFCSNDCFDGEDAIGGLTIDSAGNLYGLTSSGGVHGSGTAFQLAPQLDGTWKERVLYNFCSACANGNTPVGVPLIIDTAGNVYGVATGGRKAAGVVFKLSPNHSGKEWIQQVVYAFCKRNSSCPDGINPVGALTYVSAAAGAPYDGVSPLYGETEFGGKYHQGVVYSLTPNSSDRWLLKVLYSFCKAPGCPKGRLPSGLFADSSGNLFGTAEDGGIVRRRVGSGGTIFKVAPAGDSATNTTLYRFCAVRKCLDGAFPIGLVMDAAGNLFGTTMQGGSNQSQRKQQCFGGCGTLYQLAPDGSEAVLHSFCEQERCADGIFPLGPPLLDSAGNLFGTTQENNFQVAANATVFEFSNGTFQTLHTFCTEEGCPDGVQPQGFLLMDASGNLFGVTQNGGAHGHGTVFELSP